MADNLGTRGKSRPFASEQSIGRTLDNVQYPTPPDSQLENGDSAIQTIAEMQPLHIHPRIDQPFPPDPFLLHLDQQFPRLMITPTILHAYALMRGSNTGSNTIDKDPLHRSLYIHPSRAFNPRRLRLELVSRRHSIDELPKSSTLFWDPIDNNASQIREFQQHLPGEIEREDLPVKQTTYRDHIRHNKPTVGMNHYKGDEVLQNFGYIKIGTKWADPDSEYDLYRAIQLHEYGNDLYTPRQQPISPPHVPVPEQPWTSLRPRIMSPEEEDEFYADYIKEVTDDQDGEGDPRQYRISPATFARWAGGAASGEHFHEQPSMPSLKLPPPDRDYEDQIVARPRPDPHFDVDTGSVLSGVYETDPDPRVLQTPQGVNVVRPPAAYTYSYPHVSGDIDRHAFGRSKKHQSEVVTVPSSPEVYNSERGVQNLADTYGDLQTGEDVYDNTKDHIMTLRENTRNGHSQLFQTANTAKQTSEARITLAKEVFFLNAELAKNPPPPRPAARSSSFGPPKAYFINKDNPATPAMAKKEEARRRPRSQYQRYLDEELERQEIAAKKTEMAQQKLNAEHQEIIDEVEELRVIKAGLLDRLGVSHIDQIPNLIPRREPSCRDLRSQFGLGDA